MGKPPELRRTMAGEIKKDRELARRQVNTSPFFNTGMHPNGLGGLDSDNFVEDVSGYRLAETPEFNDLKLRGGIIGNDALANPVAVDQGFQGTSGFGLSVAGANIITINRPTPAGFTKVVVSAFGRVLGQNSTGSSDSLYTTIDINGAGGNQFPTGVGPGTGNTSTVGFGTTLTGLVSSQNVSVSLFASTGGAAWAASGSNAADLSVTYSWSR